VDMLKPGNTEKEIVTIQWNHKCPNIY
jgi:hypothetical protein